MIPAHPPPPTASYFPFQAAPTGIQTSILISESGEGLSVADTRQYAGSICGAAAGAPGAPPLACFACGAGVAGPAGAPGFWNAPAGTVIAMVMVVSGSLSDCNCSHAVCAYTAEPAAAIRRRVRVMKRPPRRLK